MKVTVLDAFINQCMNKSIIKFGALNDSGDVVDIGESSATAWWIQLDTGLDCLIKNSK